MSRKSEVAERRRRMGTDSRQQLLARIPVNERRIELSGVSTAVLAERWAHLDLDGMRRRGPEWYEAFDGYMLSRGATPHVKRTMRQLIRVGTKRIPDTELKRIEVPTALLWGRRDRMVPLSLGERTSSRLGWPLHVVDNAGHVPHMEQPEAFLRTLSDIDPSLRRREAERT